MGLDEVTSLASQTLLSPFSKRRKRAQKLWPEFCDGLINLHSTNKITIRVVMVYLCELDIY